MHDNTDVAGDVLELFKELTDADVVQDSVRTSLDAHQPINLMLAASHLFRLYPPPVLLFMYSGFTHSCCIKVEC